MVTGTTSPSSRRKVKAVVTGRGSPGGQVRLHSPSSRRKVKAVVTGRGSPGGQVLSSWRVCCGLEEDYSVLECGSRDTTNLLNR